MRDLTPIPTATLERMQAKVRRIMFMLIGLDLVAVSTLAILLLDQEKRRLVPFLAPQLLLPALVTVPVVGRLGAISVELRERRERESARTDHR